MQLYKLCSRLIGHRSDYTITSGSFWCIILERNLIRRVLTYRGYKRIILRCCFVYLEFRPPGQDAHVYTFIVCIIFKII